MANLDEIINLPLNHSDDEKREFVFNWLKNEYNISVKDDRIPLEFLAIHNHGDGQIHLGHPQIGSSFGPGGIFQIVRLPEGWHLSYKPDNFKQFIIIHPKSEAGAWSRKENQNNLINARNLLESGQLQGATTYVRPTPVKTVKTEESNTADKPIEFNAMPILNSLQTDNASSGLILNFDAALSKYDTNEVNSVENAIDESINMYDITHDIGETTSIEIDMSNLLSEPEPVSNDIDED